MVFPHRLSWLIDNQLRRVFVSPERFARRLPLSESSRVLEIGPGSGYFSVALARRIPAGGLALVDIQREMLAKARQKLHASGVRNVEFIVSDAGRPLPFRDRQFDVVLLACVLGEVQDKESCLRSLQRALRPGGLLVVAEWCLDPDMISLRKLHALVEPQGFSFRERWGSSWQYTALFENGAAGVRESAV